MKISKNDKDECIKKRFMSFPLKKRKAMGKLKLIIQVCGEGDVTITELMDAMDVFDRNNK